MNCNAPKRREVKIQKTHADTEVMDIRRGRRIGQRRTRIGVNGRIFQRVFESNFRSSIEGWMIIKFLV